MPRFGKVPTAVAALAAAVIAHAADDAWAKVRALKSGAEIRVVKRGSAEPVLAKMDELTETSLRVVVKNEQVAIPKEQIERIDARPEQKGSRLASQAKSSGPETPKGVDRSTTPHSDRPTSSYSSSVSVQGKPGFETVYRRTAAGKQ